MEESGQEIVNYSLQLFIEGYVQVYKSCLSVVLNNLCKEVSQSYFFIC